MPYDWVTSVTITHLNNIAKGILAWLYMYIQLQFKDKQIPHNKNITTNIKSVVGFERGTYSAVDKGASTGQKETAESVVCRQGI